MSTQITTSPRAMACTLLLIVAGLWQFGCFSSASSLGHAAAVRSTGKPAGMMLRRNGCNSLRKYATTSSLQRHTRSQALDAAAGGAEMDGQDAEMPPGFWEYALRDEDLTRGGRRIVQVATPFSPQGGKKIIVARVGKEAGVYAFEYMCPHLGVSLADGKFGVTSDGLTIECSQHKSVFNIENGGCVDWLPGGGWNTLQRIVTPACNLLTYPTLVRDGNIFVDMSKAKVRGNFEEWVEDRPKMKKN